MSNLFLPIPPLVLCMEGGRVNFKFNLIGTIHNGKKVGLIVIIRVFLYMHMHVAGNLM